MSLLQAVATGFDLVDDELGAGGGDGPPGRLVADALPLSSSAATAEPANEMHGPAEEAAVLETLLDSEPEGQSQVQLRRDARAP